MIDSTLLQSFMSDIEMLRALSSSSNKGSGSSLMKDSVLCDPFSEILARAMNVIETDQSRENIPLPNLFDTWFNQGSYGSRALTSADIDKMFPELANLNSLLGSR